MRIIYSRVRLRPRSLLGTTATTKYQLPSLNVQTVSLSLGINRSVSMRSFSTAKTQSPLAATRMDTVKKSHRFQLEKKFLKSFENKKAPFGYNGLGELVYYRTYSRSDPVTGKREKWQETVARVVNGCFTMQKNWIEENCLGWDEKSAQRDAQEMYRRIFSMKFLPPGRGLWAMGTALTEDRELYAALNNCAFVSTAEIGSYQAGVAPNDTGNTIERLYAYPDPKQMTPADPFAFTMDASMLGVGVGFDTLGAGKVIVKKPKEAHNKKTSNSKIVIADSREGWVDSLKMLLNSYLVHDNDNDSKQNVAVEFSYSEIRKKGLPIKGFGGTASGPDPLIELHNNVRECLDNIDGKPLTITAIVDIMNMIGKCVVAGNVRRTAEIAFGSPDSEEYVSLKDYEKNPQRMDFGWTSNNSVFAELGMDYTNVVKMIRKNGEPGFAWLDNMRKYGRMGDPPDYKDKRAAGGNPCLEQTLESYELCCLVETFPDRHTDLKDFKKTLELAFMYAKTVTLGKTHWPMSNRVMQRNRRIGCSMSGISQFIAHKGLHELQIWSDEGYKHIQKCDKMFSEWLAIPQSIKTTSIKPSGTVSLLAGATPGVHAPESRYYIRRVRLAVNSELIEPLIAAGYHVEPAETDPENTMVVSVPIDVGEGVRVQKEIGMWEQLSIAAFMQRHWADNQVSCTVTFDPKQESEEGMKAALDVFQYQLKGISFLPRIKAGAYAQMPYEEISEKQFQELSSQLKPLDLSTLYEMHSHERISDKTKTNNHESGSGSDNLNGGDDGKSNRRSTGGRGGVEEFRSMPDLYCDNDSCFFDDEIFPVDSPNSKMSEQENVKLKMGKRIVQY
uniref:ribonucleoside-triphosphate reductase (thioredoxin) n=1 Tax=Aplanochytrium stocchinoi TaxID=215587 RepID=A0A7S3PDB1_9STRA